MSKKLIRVTTLGNVQVRVVRDSEWNEYVVTLSIGGVKQAGDGYHTDNKDDALDTADLLLNKAVKGEA